MHAESRLATTVEIDGTSYRVQSSAGHLLIYKRAARGRFAHDVLYWNSRTRKPPSLGSVAARVLAAYDRAKGGKDA